MQKPKTPSVEIIKEYIRKFEADSSFVSDKALSILLSTFPKNDFLEIILLKVAALNSLYSTNIFAVDQVARHIHQLQIDVRLQNCSVQLIQEIAAVTIKSKVRRNYSFATKYCSWHMPEAYPIYDSYVDSLLWAYQKSDSFAHFARAEMQDYPTFKLIVEQFKQFYGLAQFTYKQIDNFLWLHGRECFRPSAASVNNEAAVLASVESRIASDTQEVIMQNKTQAVFDLVQEVLHTSFSAPYGIDIIWKVSLAIENNADWRRRYNELVEELHRDEVNQAIGRHVKDITGYRTLREVTAEPGHILRNYSELAQ